MCNCRNNHDCPLQGNCLVQNIIYKASVSSSDGQKYYIGSTSQSFKKRWSGHKTSFTNPKHVTDTTLSKYMGFEGEGYCSFYKLGNGQAMLTLSMWNKKVWSMHFRKISYSDGWSELYKQKLRTTAKVQTQQSVQTQQNAKLRQPHSSWNEGFGKVIRNRGKLY